MFKIKPRNTFKPIVVLILFIFLINIVSILTSNKQKSDLIGLSIIKNNEIDTHLDFLNLERFSKESKQPIKEYIKSKFIEYGYQVSEQNAGDFINIIASRGNISESHTLIGAHYDTVPGTVGIDDNASGVAALLAVAKHNHNPNIRFIAFDGEEYNLSGSRYYVKNTSLKPDLVIILETIGYYSDEVNSQTLPRFYNIFYPKIYNRIKSNQFKGNFTASICANSAKKFCDKFESYASSLGLNVYSVYIPNNPLLRPVFIDLFRSDHAPFLLDGIPSVMITDTANFRNPNYHKSTDTRYTVDTEFITKQANTLLSVISD